MTQVRLEPAAPRSRVKNSTIQALRSLFFFTFSDTQLTFLYASGSKMRALANSEDPGSTLFQVIPKEPHIYIYTMLLEFGSVSNWNALFQHWFTLLFISGCI